MKRLRGIALLLVFLAGTNAAAANVTGSIVGRVLDKDTGAARSGVTVVVTGPQGDDQAALTRDDGRFEVHGLPIGDYVVRFYQDQVVVERPGVLVSVDKTVRVDARMPQTAVETITVIEKAPAIDVGSSRVGATLNQAFANNVASTLNVGGLLEKTPGAYVDRLQLSPSQPQEVASVSLGGGTGAENSYVLDGVNVTSIGYGLLSSDIPTAFVDEVEIISGGYNAEYGRALGGVVNIATKSGSNEWHGSAFSHVSPGWGAGNPRRVLSSATSLTMTTKSDYTTNFGAEVGGPIVKNRLFFWGGYAPDLEWNHSTRYADRFVDADGNRAEIYRRNVDGTAAAHQYAGKLTYRLAPEHSLSLGVYGIHGSKKNLRMANADVDAAMTRDRTRSHDVSMRWLSKLLDRRWQLEGNLGLHAEGADINSPSATARARNGVQWFNSPSLAQFEMDPAVAKACMDDPMADFMHCPVNEYQSGGYGIGRDVAALRLSAGIKSTHLFRAGGWHQLKYGAGYEWNQYDDARSLTGPDGGRAFVTMNGDFVQNQTLFRLRRGERLFQFNDGDGADPDPDKNGKREDLLNPPSYRDVLRAKTSARNTDVFLQDSYSPLPNLTLNAGLRWESQQLTDFEGRSAITIRDSFAPRVGVVYDPTNSGHSKLFGNYGRFYESIPLDLTNRAFGGEGILVSQYEDSAACKQPFDSWGDGNPATSWRGCPAPGHAALAPVAGENLLVQKNIKGSYTNEIVVGIEHEVMEDLVVGAAYIRRWLGRAIEDANGIVANPGDVPQKVVDELESRAVMKEAAAMAPGASAQAQAEAQEARFLADATAGVAVMPKAKREYNALQLTATKRFSRKWFLQASYTFSRNQGNYTGLYAADHGQLDPNYTTQYDLPELLLNRQGPLPNDRPHLGRLDGYYQWALGKAVLTPGLSFIAQSGRPANTLGSHQVYGPGEVFILPRGEAGRTPTITRFDLHLSYRRKISDGSTLDVFLDVFNLLNQRTALAEDLNYTFSPVEPIVGGDAKDLAHLKDASGDPVTPNPNYRKAIAYQAPIAGRLGLRWMF